MRLEDYLGRIDEDLASLFSSISRASIRIWEILPFNTGLLIATNPYGERQSKIDVLSNDLFKDSLLSTGKVAQIASEEMERPVMGEGKFYVAMDPLDGSSNIETNNTLGSIFAFFTDPLPCRIGSIKAACYVSYGPMLTITLTAGDGVRRFVAVRSGNQYEFELMEDGIRIPDRPEVYGIGGNRKDWIPEVEEFVSKLESMGMKMRYCGTLVGDFNQVMKHGGIFAYPSLKSRPKGKLRVLYECAPISYIAEQAGGYSSNGMVSILSLKPSELSETTPIYVGSRSLVKEIEQIISSKR